MQSPIATHMHVEADLREAGLQGVVRDVQRDRAVRSLLHAALALHVVRQRPHRLGPLIHG